MHKVPMNTSMNFCKNIIAVEVKPARKLSNLIHLQLARASFSSESEIFIVFLKHALGT